MAYQTTLDRTNGSSQAPAAALRHNMGDFAADLVSLAELQWKLLTLDLRQCAGNLVGPAVAGGLAMAFGLAAFPLLLAAVALGLAAAGIPLGWSLLIAAVVGFFIAGAAAGIAWTLIRNSLQPIERSHRELIENLRWIKASLNRNGRATQAAACRTR